MATFTTQRSGNWSDIVSGTRPWVILNGSGLNNVPGAGDSITIAAGHTLTVDTNQAIGTSGVADSISIGASTGAIATLAIAAGVTLTYYGNRSLSYGDFTMAAGSNLIFSGTGPERFHFYNGNSNRANDITISGTSGSRCSIKGASASSRFGISQTSSFRNVSISYCDFQYGDTSASWPNMISLGGSETSILIDNCVFEDGYSGIFQSSALSAATNFTLTNTTIKDNFTASKQAGLTIKSGATATGTRLIRNCSFGAGIQSTAGGFLNYTIDHCVFNRTVAAGTASAAPITTSAAGKWTALQNCLIRTTADSNCTMPWMGDILNNLFLYDSSAGVDPNVVRADQTTSGSGNIGKVQGNVCQAYATGANAAWFFLMTAWNPASATSISVLNNVILPNITTGNGCGSVFNCSAANSNTSVTVEHNTFSTDGSTFVGGILLGDANNTVSAGVLASCRGNLGYGTVTAAGNNNAILRYFSSAVAIDACAPANCEYNGGSFLKASSSPYAQTSKAGYVTSATQNIFSSAPGSNTSDVSSTTGSTDPAFFDSTRDMSTAYSATTCLNQSNISRAGNFQAITEYIASTINANPTRIADVVTWIKAGWAPKNSAYNATWGTDTNTVKNIGAVQGIFGGPWPYHLDNQNMSSFAAGMGL